LLRLEALAWLLVDVADDGVVGRADGSRQNRLASEVAKKEDISADDIAFERFAERLSRGDEAGR
jgi:hypothetical protein